MNWNTYHVSDVQLRGLLDGGEPIPVPVGVLESNAGVEVFSLSYRTNAIYDANLGAIRKLNGFNPQFRNIPNRDLLLLNDHLLNQEINTIIVDGFFGVGKTSTVCSHLVYGLMETLEGRSGISKAYISKPHEPLGKTYGHLPGELYEKTVKEFQSYFQYFTRFGKPMLAEVLMGIADQKFGSKPEQPLLEVLVFEYLRGRDIDTGWVILDEAQNTSREEMTSFISRVGDRVKLIVLGDTTPTQIDRKGNTSNNNGLTFAKNAFAGKKYAGIVSMQTVNHIIRGQRVRDLFVAVRG